MRSSSTTAKVILVLSTSLLLTSTLYIIHTTVLARLQPQLGTHQCTNPMTSTPFAGRPPPAAPRRHGAGAVDEQPQQQLSGASREHLSDPYTWLRDDSRSDPSVLQYLQEENSYAAAYFQPLQDLVDDIIDDMDSRVPTVEVSAPKLQGRHVYFDTRGPGDDYWNTYRQPLLLSSLLQQPLGAALQGVAQPAAAVAAGSSGADKTALAGSSTDKDGSSLAAAVAGIMAAAQHAQQGNSSHRSRHRSSHTKHDSLQQGSSNSSSSSSGAQLVLDQNALSRGHVYWDVVRHEVSPDGSLMALLYDTVGEEDFNLQVLAVASGIPLLPEPISGCGETLAWWGNSSSVLAYSSRSHNGTHLMLLQLPQHNHKQQQGQQEQQQDPQQQQCALLYAPVQGERGVELSLSADRRFVIVSSSIEGSTQVLALPTNTPLNFNSSSGSSSSSSSSDSSSGGCGSQHLPLAVPAAAWWQVVLPSSGLDVLSIEHLGDSSCSSSSNGSSGSGSGSNGSRHNSSSSKEAVFVALVDSDESPDGEVVLIHAAAPGSNDSSSSRNSSSSKPRMEVLVANYSLADGSSSTSSSSRDDSSSSRDGSSSSSRDDSGSDRTSLDNSSDALHSSISHSSSRSSSRSETNSLDAGRLKQHGQQQQQHSGDSSQQQPPLEIRSFKLHPRGSHIAVAVRRQGVCAVDVYALPGHTAAAAAAAGGQLQALGSPAAVFTLRTRDTSSNNSSSSKSVKASAAASNTGHGNSNEADVAATAAAAASAAATAGLSAARLSWVLVLEEPTLLLELVGVMTNHDVITGLKKDESSGPTHESSTPKCGGDGAGGSDSWLAVRVSGITSPTAVYYVNMADPQQQVKVYQEHIPGFDAAAYTSRLEWAASGDGVRVPLTLAFNRQLFKQDGSHKAILHAYGAYGSSQWPSFNPADLALLDRGVVLAICHVRGGGELGSHWHTAATKMHKRRTFEDLLACADHLTTQGYTSSSRLGLWGRSAGGLTLGAALNMRPGLAAAAVLDVPFLDVLGDMSDPDLPLTVKERSEWGDPLASKAVRKYIASYSPLHNLDPQQAHSYPALLLTASLHDTRVNFWEPAKYVATLRYLKQQQQQQQHQQQQGATRPLLLMTDLQSGHFAASGASSRLEERALKLAFLLTNLDC